MISYGIGETCRSWLLLTRRYCWLTLRPKSFPSTTARFMRSRIKNRHPYQLCSRFLADPARYMHALFEEEPLFRNSDDKN